MGLSLGMSSGSSYQTNPVNPNPSRFKLVRVKKVTWGQFWVAMINYPGCTNFEGNKVLVLNFNPRKAVKIDPHFTLSGGVIARFAPTEDGWKHALRFAESLKA